MPQLSTLRDSWESKRSKHQPLTLSGPKKAVPGIDQIRQSSENVTIDVKPAIPTYIERPLVEVSSKANQLKLKPIVMQRPLQKQISKELI